MRVTLTKHRGHGSEAVEPREQRDSVVLCQTMSPYLRLAQCSPSLQTFISSSSSSFFSSYPVWRSLTFIYVCLPLFGLLRRRFHGVRSGHRFASPPSHASLPLIFATQWFFFSPNSPAKTIAAIPIRIPPIDLSSERRYRAVIPTRCAQHARLINSEFNGIKRSATRIPS